MKWRRIWKKRCYTSKWRDRIEGRKQCEKSCGWGNGGSQLLHCISDNSEFQNVVINALICKKPLWMYLLKKCPMYRNWTVKLKNKSRWPPKAPKSSTFLFLSSALWQVTTLFTFISPDWKQKESKASDTSILQKLHSFTSQKSVFLNWAPSEHKLCHTLTRSTHSHSLSLRLPFNNNTIT